MDEHTNLLVERAGAYNEALTIPAIMITNLQIRSNTSSNNENEGLDVNGISGIVIGVLGLFVAIIGIVKGLEFWQRRPGRNEISTTAYSGDIETGAPNLDNHRQTTFSGSTVVNHVWNIHISPRVVTPTPAVLPLRRAFDVGEVGLNPQAQASPETGGITPRERVLTWPSHKRLR